MPAYNSQLSPAEKIEQLKVMLSGRDPLRIQETTVAEIEESVGDLSEEHLHTTEPGGKWSILDVVQHLADTEIAMGWRLRMILAQDNPPLQAFDQDLWAQNLGYRDVEFQDALDQFDAVRSANLRLYRNLESRLDRVGQHNETGPISARSILYMLANHDLTHLRQIERIKQALGA